MARAIPVFVISFLAPLFRTPAIRILPLLAFAIITLPVFAQVPDYPYDIPEYDFIQYDSNRIVFPGDSSSWENFMAGFSRMVSKGDNRLSIVHIGGSHIQADIYPDRIRSRLQTFQPGSNAGRGLIFPYSVARTNNPSNYRVAYTGKWTSCRNSRQAGDCPLGLTGISVTTFDTSSTISISFPEGNAVSYDFDRVRIFFLDDSISYACSIHTENAAGTVVRNERGLSEEPGMSAAEGDQPVNGDSTGAGIPDGKGPGALTWNLEDYADRLEISLMRTSPYQQRFTLFGISLETDDPGLVYHSIGVNGAKVPSFLACQLLPEQLAALSPDMVILSLGTNDAYTRYFNPAAYKWSYDSLICRIRDAAPQAAILLTVPNDSYLYRKYINPNTALVREVIMELAAEHNCGVWDFYTVMGGLNSIVVWQRFGLAKRDRIHFTEKGYLLMGDLFFNAFLKTYDNFIDYTNQTIRRP
jgi:lysophospholipase L1-like esterase